MQCHDNTVGRQRPHEHLWSAREKGDFKTKMDRDVNKAKIKYIALGVLVAQNISLVLTMRYSRTIKGHMYLASTAVVSGEVMKLLTCLILISIKHSFNMGDVVMTLKKEIWDRPGDTMKLAVPACLYTMQANLLYLAISNLDAATFQVTYQLKIMTTALFSVLMLGAKLSSFKWMALFILMTGVALVQLPANVFDSSSEINFKLSTDGGSFRGIVAVLIACVSSGFAGIYFEKLLKSTATDLWIRNIQLGMFGFFLGLVGVYMTNRDEVLEYGFFQGYSSLVWVVVTLNAAGGLVIAVVVKYADNILKGFATSVSIILSSILSIFFFDFHPSSSFIVGATLVVGSVFMYGRPDPKPGVVLP